MSECLSMPSIDDTPEALLDRYIAQAASRLAPIAVDSEEGKRLYRTLAQQVWLRRHRPVLASDICELWESIDSIKRGAPVRYGLHAIHFWAADYANALAADTVTPGEATGERLAAWLDDWPNVCVLGRTGRGKSTLINRLFGCKVAEISHHEACTDTVSDYRLVTGQFLNRPTGVTMWDVPGFGDEMYSWDRFVKLYRRLAKECDVVVFMFDDDRHMGLELKMFRKLRKRVPQLDRKLVVAVNKADLFYPCDWDVEHNTPSEAMRATLQQRAAKVAFRLEIRDTDRIVPISALKNWNILKLLEAMVDAAGESKGAQLLRAVRQPEDAGNEGNGEAGKSLARRFGIRDDLRQRFRNAIVTS